MLPRLKALGLDERGRHRGDHADRARRSPAPDGSRRVAPGHPDDAVIWESVESSRPTPRAGPTVSFLVFLVLAALLAAIAVITDSAVLVVGAMVVGPEFGAVAAIAAGMVLRPLGPGRRARCACW